MVKNALLSLISVLFLQPTFASEIQLNDLSQLFDVLSMSGKKGINLADADILKPLLAPQFQEDELSLSKALETVKRVYEAKPRVVETNLHTTTKYGMVFPINPEIMAELMPKCLGKVVLEIAGASGENSILFAFAGAQHVYLNDIEANEIEKFNQAKEALPLEVKSRLTPLCCDFFDLANNKDLLAKIEIVFCRGFLHFFTDKRIEAFFPLLKSFLKPDAEVIFLVNGAHKSSYSSVLTENPTTTRFARTVCQFFDYDKNGRMPYRDVFVEVSACTEDLDPLSYEKFIIYKKIPGTIESGGTNGKWVVNNDDVKKLDANTINKINEEKNKPAIKPLMLSAKYASVELLKNTMRAYTAENLTNLFEKNGFIVEKNVFTSDNGHETSQYLNPHFVGVIAKYQ